MAVSTPRTPAGLSGPDRALLGPPSLCPGTQGLQVSSGACCWPDQCCRCTSAWLCSLLSQFPYWLSWMAPRSKLPGGFVPLDLHRISCWDLGLTHHQQRAVRAVPKDSSSEPRPPYGVRTHSSACQDPGCTTGRCLSQPASPGTRTRLGAPPGLGPPQLLACPLLWGHKPARGRRPHLLQPRC